jgi:hypothetical protein
VIVWGPAARAELDSVVALVVVREGDGVTQEQTPEPVAAQPFVASPMVLTTIVCAAARAGTLPDAASTTRLPRGQARRKRSAHENSLREAFLHRI